MLIILPDPCSPCHRPTFPLSWVTRLAPTCFLLSSRPSLLTRERCRVMRAGRSRFCVG